MPSDYRRSFSRSPRRSRSRSPVDRRGASGAPGNRYYGDRDRNSRDRDYYHRDSYNEYQSRYPSDYRDRSVDSRERYSEEDMCRVHIADLSDKVTQYEVEKSFGKFGDIKEVWMAKNPPCFAFVVYKRKDEASLAVKEMDGRTLGPGRIRVTFARPRTKGRRRRWDPNMRCYQCGQRGHFSRDCDGGNFRRRYERSFSRDRSRRARSRSRSYTRSRTPRRDYHSSSVGNGHSDHRD